jgi:hypothetical protein
LAKLYTFIDNFCEAVVRIWQAQRVGTLPSKHPIVSASDLLGLRPALLGVRGPSSRALLLDEEIQNENPAGLRPASPGPTEKWLAAFAAGACGSCWPEAADIAVQRSVRFQGCSDRAPTSGTGCER